MAHLARRCNVERADGRLWPLPLLHDILDVPGVASLDTEQLEASGVLTEARDRPR